MYGLFVAGFSKAIAQYGPRDAGSVFGRARFEKPCWRIFIDYLRNGKDASTAAAFSARARSGLGVSMPVAWDELPGIKAADQWQIKTAALRQRGLGANPWQGYFRCRQGITAAMRRSVGMR